MNLNLKAIQIIKMKFHQREQWNEKYIRHHGTCEFTAKWKFQSKSGQFDSDSKKFWFQIIFHDFSVFTFSASNWKRLCNYEQNSEFEHFVHRNLSTELRFNIFLTLNWWSMLQKAELSENIENIDQQENTEL